MIKKMIKKLFSVKYLIMAFHSAAYILAVKMYGWDLLFILLLIDLANSYHLYEMFIFNKKI